MFKSQKGFGIIEIILTLAVAILLVGVGGYVFTHRSVDNSAIGNDVPAQQSGNVDIEVITGAGGMPPEDTKGQLLKGEAFTVVFTEPFASLEKWADSKVLKEFKVVDGKANISVEPGKYGVYYIYQNNKILYGDLTLENPKPNVQRDKQGPWYVEVKAHRGLKLKFSINTQAV
jgi:hypothetical protein